MGKGGGVYRAKGAPPPDSHEVAERDIERVGDKQQVREVGDTRRHLEPVDRLVVTADEFTKPHLGKLRVKAGGTDACPDIPAAGGYPVGQGVEWHSTTLE